MNSANSEASTTEVIKIRVNRYQKDLIRQKAKVHGYTTVSAFCRDRIFDDFGIDRKLNKVLEILEGKENKKPGSEDSNE